MIEGFHFQNAYVTRNIEKWIGIFRKQAKVDFELTYQSTGRVRTPAGEMTQNSKLAFIWVGDLQYELIQPVDGAVEIFRDALPADDGLAFHHVCMRIDDWDDFRRRVAGQPYPVVREGASDMLRFVYLDARPLLGHYLEYIWMDDSIWKQMGGR
jgi:Glyoxalase/Bleomycin resistance protein/Dioxygenase superfamily